jgi:hypothetical protein
MMLAQTTVDDPKYGASRRDAAISVASVQKPAVKTTSPRRALESLDSTAGSMTTSSRAAVVAMRIA